MKPGDGVLQIVQHLYLVCLSLTLGHFPDVVVKSSSVQSVVSETCRVQCVMEAAESLMKAYLPTSARIVSAKPPLLTDDDLLE